MGMGVHCQKCGRHVVIDTPTVHLAPEACLYRLSQDGSNAALWIEADRGAAGMAKPKAL